MTAIALLVLRTGDLKMVPSNLLGSGTCHPHYCTESLVTYYRRFSAIVFYLPLHKFRENEFEVLDVQIFLCVTQL